MKNTLLLIAIAITSIHISANAQQIATGNITIDNKTDCEIAWNAWAYCESQCPTVTTWYNSGAMRFLAPNTSVMYDQSNYPWFGTNPTCSDFRWSYVDINVQCGGGYLASPVKAQFELCNNNFLGGVIARNCCGGQDVSYYFTFVGADIIVTIDY